MKRTLSPLPALALVVALFGCATDPPRGDPDLEMDLERPIAGEEPSIELVTRSVDEDDSHAESADAKTHAENAESADAKTHAENAENAESADAKTHAENAESAETGSGDTKGKSSAAIAEASDDLIDAPGGAEAKASAESPESDSRSTSADPAEEAATPVVAAPADEGLLKRYEANIEELLQDIVRSEWFHKWFREHFDEFKDTLSGLVDKATGGASAAAAPAQPAAAPEIPWKTETYSLVARSMDLRQVLETFGVAQGISTILSPAVGGALSGEFADVPCGEFLDRLCSMHNLAWYWDGATLWINAASEMQTILLDLRYMKAGEVRAMLAELGVEDPRFPLKTASKDELIMVSGPPRYLRERRTFNEIETRLFPLQNTWADDVSFSASSPESSGSIKGVASMLKDIVGTIASPGSRAAGDTNAPASFKPLITSENRLNAVIVTDVAPRMPLYERLVRELDVPQKLVEIEVTVVEMSRKDALDWQLSIAGTGTKDRLSGGVGQNAGNLFSAEDLAGRGLAGALSYLGSKSTVSASLTALRDKGKARNISRTTLLTVNNLAASLSDQQTYHARVIGTEVAELAEVSAGTTLQVKPRIMRLGDDAVPTRIWLTLSLEDGGFESVSVDSMPMTRTSSLDTQTSVYEEDTIVLAGYLRDIEETAGWGIPWLRDIPLLGWLFGGHSSKTETVQRLFLISPRIVDPDAEDLARLQAMRLRDIEEMETLNEDAEDADEVRELRALDRQERRERRQDALDERLEERKRELVRAREERARLRKEREAEREEVDKRRGCLPW